MKPGRGGPSGPRSGAGSRREVIRRRLVSVPAVSAVALGSTVMAPVALPLVVLVDLLRLRWRLPLARLYCFGVAWSWLEVLGVLAAAALWVTGRSRDRASHYRLQAWWADKVMAALRVTCGLDPQVEGAEALQPGPTLLLVRHASLADSLLTAWVITNSVGMRPRVVMKKELLVDPCLDIVGNRLPNTFVDRAAADSGPELAAIAAMAGGLGAGEVAVLFPEGTRVNPRKQARALESIARRDPARADRVSGLRHLLPPRPAGAATLVAATQGAAACVAWHTGFEGLDSFGGIIGALGAKPRPVRMRIRRLGEPPEPGATEESPVVSSPPGDFVEWLDELWCEIDDSVDRMLATPGPAGTPARVQRGRP